MPSARSPKEVTARKILSKILRSVLHSKGSIYDPATDEFWPEVQAAVDFCRGRVGLPDELIKEIIRKVVKRWKMEARV